jgi:hypothetical protein
VADVKVFRQGELIGQNLDQVRNLRLQLEFATQQNRANRVRLNRYEAILGMEQAA